MPTKQQVVTYGLESEKGEEWLGAVLKSSTPQFILDMQGFGRPGGTESLGGLTKEQHARKILADYYPWLWKTWNDWAELCMWAYCNHNEVGATGCTASGKSMILSILIWLEWSAAPLQTAGILTSTTKQGIRSRIWTHIKKMRSSLFLDGKQTVYPCHLIDSQTLLQAHKGDDMHCITSLAVEGGVLEQSWGNLIGRHPKRMVAMIDEAEQTPEAIFKSRFNLQAGTDFYRFLCASNAVNPTSSFGIFIEPVGGWSSVKDTDEFWQNKTGVTIHFDGLASPNVKAGRVVVPGLIRQETIDNIRNAEGENSLVWWSMVRGFPPMSGVRNTVLSWAMILANKATAPVVWQGEVIWIAGLDAAFTSGGDRCLLQFARVGLRDDGTQTLGFEPPIHIKLVSGGDISEDYQIAERVREECTKRKVKPEHFAMDATAASGLASIIEQRWARGILRINFGSSATDRRMPGDDKTAKDRCRNRVAELWMSFAALVRGGQVRGLTNDSAQEFCTRQFTLVGEKYALEPKSEMKARTGGKSPDAADVSSLVADVFRNLHGVGDERALAGPSNRDAWIKAARKFNLVESY